VLAALAIHALIVAVLAQPDFTHRLHKDSHQQEKKAQSRKLGLTETRLRPFARRRERTAAPALVFIRVRKPCVFARWRRFG
jgi:hypothetical protein